MMCLKKTLIFTLGVGCFVNSSAMYQAVSPEKVSALFADEESSAWQWDDLCDGTRACVERQKSAVLTPIEPASAGWWRWAQRRVGTAERDLIPAFVLREEWMGAERLMYAFDHNSRFVYFDEVLLTKMPHAMIRFFLLCAAVTARDLLLGTGFGFSFSEAEISLDVSINKKAELGALTFCRCYQCLTDVARMRLAGMTFDEAAGEAQVRTHRLLQDRRAVDRLSRFGFGDYVVRNDGFNVIGHLKPSVLLMAADDLKKDMALCHYHQTVAAAPTMPPAV